MRRAHLSFDGGVILAAVLIALYVHRRRLPGWYMDAGAAGLGGLYEVNSPP